MTSYTVRVTRSDGSVTFRGQRMTEQAAKREQAAWNHHGFSAEIVSNLDARDECKAWRLATKHGGRYYPSNV